MLLAGICGGYCCKGCLAWEFEADFTYSRFCIEGTCGDYM